MVVIILFLSSFREMLALPGEIWFLFDDDNNSNYKVVASRISSSDPLFGTNFLEVNTTLYDQVTCSTDALPGVFIQEPFDYRRGFDYLRDPEQLWPLIGEGKLQFSVYLDNILVFNFRIDLVHSVGTPDITFEYTASTGEMYANSGGANPIITQIEFDEFVNCWELLGENRDISDYVNDVELSNYLDNSVENNIKIAFDNAFMGFPNEDVQLDLQYDPGTVVRLWGGVYYDIYI
jgi:hypothetical protein